MRQHRVPTRCSLEERPRAPRPAGQRADRPLHPLNWFRPRLARFNEWLYGVAVGRWLRRRLDRALELRSVEISLARLGPALDGLQIAFLSDLHAGHFATEPDLVRLFERVMRCEPDLICLGGDLVDARPEDCRILAKALPILRAPLGVFAVPGNHDYYADPSLRLWQHCLEQHGVSVLSNRGVRIGRGDETLWLAGVDDLSEGEPDLAEALDGVRPDEAIVLLSHHPDFFLEAAFAGVDLMLSGHTHAGQITAFGRTPLRHTRHGYWHGHFEQRGARLYVGSGTGTTAIPLRVFAAAEVPLIRLIRPR